jgi:hypothetical protein
MPESKPVGLPTQAIISVPVENLRLDRENPRLPSADIGSDVELLRYLWREMAVDEVALSIAANGFFPEEPLLVVPEKKGKRDPETDKFIVVEGNRRLAAVLLLRDASLRQKLKTDLPEIDDAASEKLSRLPVSIYDDRKDLWEYLGFRHINGPKEWDAFSKAKYVAKVREQYKIELEEIARRIGDKHAFVKRIYRGYLLVQQAEAEAAFNAEDINKNRFNFSHLYTAASEPEFQRFLGIDASNSLKPSPVPKEKLSELKELMLWLYGSKTAKKLPLVRTQNPDLNILREVIGKPAALAVLRSGYPLSRAYDVSIGDARRFEEALTRAKEDLLLAKGTVTTGYGGGEELFTVVTEIVQVAGKIQEEMTGKREQATKKVRK